MKKKILSITLAIILCFTMVLGLSACDMNFKKLSGQKDILTELRSLTTDIGIMDSVMAEYYVNISDDLMIIDGLKLSDEFYGIAFKKLGEGKKKYENKGMTDKVNVALAELSADGKIATLAEKYNISSALIDIEYTSIWDTLTDADKVEYNRIMAKGEMILGYTVFAPIAYEDNNEMVGFDIELAKAVCEKLGVKLKTKRIEWDKREFEIYSDYIDCIWNGFTISEERKANLSFSAPYLKNSQVAVIRKADKDKYTSDMKTFQGAKIAAEKSSAGFDAYKYVIKPKMNEK